MATWCYRLLRCNRTTEENDNSLPSSFEEGEGNYSTTAVAIAFFVATQPQKKTMTTCYCHLLHCNITKKKKLMAISCHRLFHRNRKKKATTNIAMAFFAATEPKNKGGNLREGACLQAPTLAY
jgi:hypothetical protein